MNRLTLAVKALTTRNAKDSDIVNMSGAYNLFGSLGRGLFPFQTDMDFIPVDNEGGVMKTKGGHNPQWMGLSTPIMQSKAYGICAPLSSVIDRIAEADTNGRIEFRDEDDNTLKSSFVNKSPRLKRIKNLLYEPNPWQTFEEWNSQQVILAKTHGYCLVFAIGGMLDKSYATALINIPADMATPVANENFNIYDKANNNPISEWKIWIYGKDYTIPASDILIVKDGYITSNINKFGLPQSKMNGLDYSVSNICAAMEADNVLLKKKGPLGVFSHEGVKDPAGMTPMTDEVKRDLQEQLQRYGLTVGQLQYVISRGGLKWNPVSFNVAELQTKETVRQCIDNICDRYGYPAELMSGKNATYENRSSAERFLYQTVIIPFSLRRMAKYNKFFGLEDTVKLYLDYGHLAVLQEDIMRAGQAAEANANANRTNWEAGMITWNEYRVELGMDKVVGGDIYYPQWIKDNPEMAALKTKNKNPDANKTKPKN